jgi:DNA-binding NarL/FixJ family response regulator
MSLKKQSDIRILHANSNVLMHQGLLKICSSGGGIQKIDHVENETELFEKLKSNDYDLILVDPKNDHGFKIETVLKLQREKPEIKMLIISDIKNEGMVLQILERGVQGYLTYECDTDEIVHAIFAIAKGEKFYCNKVLDIVFNKHLYKKEVDDCEATNLTVRENEIAVMLARGLSNKEVAEKIHLSPHTVHTHRKNIMKKLGVRSASELTIYALSIGLIEA